MLPAPTCARQQSCNSLLHITLLNMPVSLQLARTHSPLLQGEQSLNQGLFEAQVSGSSFQEQHQMYSGHAVPVFCRKQSELTLPAVCFDTCNRVECGVNWQHIDILIALFEAG